MEIAKSKAGTSCCWGAKCTFSVLLHLSYHPWELYKIFESWRKKSFWCLWLLSWATVLLLVVVVGWEKVCRIFSGCSLLHSTSSPVAWILWDFIIGNYWQIFPQNVLWFPKLYPHFRFDGGSAEQTYLGRYILIFQLV